MKFLLGLLLGIGIAAGVVLYINNKTTISQFMPTSPTHSSNSQDQSDKANASNPIILAPSTKTMQQASEVTTQQNAPEAENTEKQSYDFYDVLEGKKSLNESGQQATAPKKVVENSKIFLQVGAYSNSDEANNMKARLILMDIDSKIISADANGKILNKVIVGPFPSAEDARKAQSAMQEQGISAIITNISS